MAFALMYAVFFVFTCVFLGLLVYWHLRPNTSYVAEGLDIETWDVRSDGNHNAFTDMVYWQDRFYLTCRSAFTHLGFKSKLIVMASSDARTWETLAELSIDDQDLRDPKLVVIGDRLFLYALKNKAIFVKPYTTVCSFSEDGQSWADWQEIEPAGWALWRPMTADGSTWYVAGCWQDYRKSALFRSSDGMNWEMVSSVHEGDMHAEVAILFASVHKLIGTVRMVGATIATLLGGSTDTTLVGSSPEPYVEWTFKKSHVTRLDGPNLFLYEDKAYAAGRFEPAARSIFLKRGNFLCRKRTSLFLIEEDGLVYLSDIPSAGDTSYPGTVMKEGDLYVSYYTSAIHRDYPWILGLIMPTSIRMARIRLSTLPS